VQNYLAPLPRSLISRVAAILSTFLTGDTHSITEISRLTGLPVSTTHRLAAELASWQLLNRAADGRYEVGLTLRRLGGDAWSIPALHERAPNVVTDLCEVTRRRARLGILRGGQVAYIEKRVGVDPATPFCPGATLPAHATALGKALLAFSARETVASVQQRLTAYTAHTVTTPDQLHRALHTIRLTRTAVACDELAMGDCAIAAPVFGCRGSVVAALELQMHDPRVDIDMCKATLAVAARGLSRELALDGHRLANPRLRLLPDGAPAAAPVPPRAAAGT
jgi:DNA-binding IclR family transcriptional regulator